MLLCSKCVAVCHPFDLELVWKFVKFTQRSISNSSIILIWRTSILSYNRIHVISKELLCSQGTRRCLPTQAMTIPLQPKGLTSFAKSCSDSYGGLGVSSFLYSIQFIILNKALGIFAFFFAMSELYITLNPFSRAVHPYFVSWRHYLWLTRCTNTKHIDASTHSVLMFPALQQGKYKMFQIIGSQDLGPAMLYYTNKCATCVLHVWYTCNTHVVFIYISTAKRAK